MRSFPALRPGTGTPVPGGVGREQEERRADELVRPRIQALHLLRVHPAPLREQAPHEDGTGGALDEAVDAEPEERTLRRGRQQ